VFWYHDEDDGDPVRVMMVMMVTVIVKLFLSMEKREQAQLSHYMRATLAQ
jgi:hypothetical protein